MSPKRGVDTKVIIVNFMNQIPFLELAILATIEEPLTTTPEDSPIFGNVRRKPLPGRPSPPETAEELTGSAEITAPQFPMFQFTSSMEANLLVWITN